MQVFLRLIPYRYGLPYRQLQNINEYLGKATVVHAALSYYNVVNSIKLKVTHQILFAQLLDRFVLFL